VIVNIYLINGHSSLQYGIWTGFPSAGWYNPTSRRRSGPSWNREVQKLNSVLGHMSLPQILLSKLYRSWPIVESSCSPAACSFETFFYVSGHISLFFFFRAAISHRMSSWLSWRYWICRNLPDDIVGLHIFPFDLRYFSTFPFDAGFLRDVSNVAGYFCRFTNYSGYFLDYLFDTGFPEVTWCWMGFLKVMDIVVASLMKPDISQGFSMF